MRFEELVLERYGAFTDRVLTFDPSARLHVVLGANEAGKTSALAAIGDLLFGFGKRTPYDFQHEGKTLRLAARLRLSDGAALAFRRRKGDKNTILDADDKPLGDDLLAPLLGAVSRETFFCEFGLTSRALREGGEALLEAGGRLSETLAASSARLSALSRLRARLDTEAEALFGARRAAGKAFYAAEDRYKEADRRLRDAIVTPEALKAAQAAEAEATTRGEALRAEIERIGREQARLRRAQSVGPSLRALDVARAESAGLADLPRIDAGTARGWRDALAAQAATLEALAESDAQDAEDKAAIAALAIDEPLLASEATIGAAREKLGAVRKAEEDLPARRGERRAAEAALTQAAQALGLASRAALVAAAPGDLQLAAAREALEARKNAGTALADAQRRLAEAQREAARLAAEAPAHAADPAPLLLRFEAFADIPVDADALRRDAAALANEQRALAEDAARLDPAVADLDDLARRPLPDLSRIEAARGAWNALAEAEQRAGADRAAAAAALTKIDKEIAALSREGAAATRDDLAAARDARDDAADGLEATLDGEAVARRARFAALTAADRALDATTDLLLGASDRAARLSAARDRLGEARVAAETAQAAGAATTQRRAQTEADWAALWAPGGVSPRSPEAMAGWTERVTQLLTRRRRLAERRAAMAALTEKLEAQRAPLAALAQALGDSAEPALPIETLHRVTRAALEKLRDAWAAARKDAALREAAGTALARARDDCDGLTATLDGLAGNWRTAMASIGAGEAASPAQADAALAVWREYRAQKQEFDQLDHRIGAMEEDIAAFSAEVAGLVAGAAPDLAGAPPRAALDTLTRRLNDARAAAQRRATLLETVQKRALARATLAKKAERAAATLEQARATLALPAEAPLEPALDRLDRRTALEADIARRLAELPAIGDGLDEATLRAEREGLDPALLPTALDRLEIEQKQALDDYGHARAACAEARRLGETLTEGRDAESAAREKTEAEAELLAVTERWLERAAAARLAARAIERHRAAVEDPLLARASELFSIATAGAFTRLVADWDDGDSPRLAGERPGGGRTPVDGMSEGARDQLFLSLRLALLELRAAEPLPFVGDDLLASFDEERVARALGLFADFGTRRQVVLFTHHRHVADIAEMMAGTQIIGL